MGRVSVLNLFDDSRKTRTRRKVPWNEWCVVKNQNGPSDNRREPQEERGPQPGDNRELQFPNTISRTWLCLFFLYYACISHLVLFLESQHFLPRWRPTPTSPRALAPFLKQSPTHTKLYSYNRHTFLEVYYTSIKWDYNHHTLTSKRMN